VMVPQAFPRSGVDAPVEGSATGRAPGSPGNRLFRGDPALADGVTAQQQLRAAVDADAPVLAPPALDVALHRLLGGAHVLSYLADRAAAGVEHQRAHLLPAERRVLPLRVLRERPLD